MPKKNGKGPFANSIGARDGSGGGKGNGSGAGLGKKKGGKMGFC